MKIKRTDLVHIPSAFHSVILSSCTDEHIATVDSQNPLEEIEITMSFNGIDLNPSKWFKRMWAELDERVEERAKEIVKEKYVDLMTSLERATQEVESNVAASLTATLREAGIRFREDDY